MNNTTKNDSTRVPPTAKSGRPSFLRNLALVAMIATGAVTLYVVASPIARAIADSPAGDDGSSFMERMHGMHTHADLHAHFEKVMTEAGVDPAQQQQIHAIMKAAMTDEHADLQRFHDNLRQLKALLVAARIDDAAIASVRREQDRLVLATSHRISDTAVKVAKILTPEQRARLGAQIDQMMASHTMQVPAG
jgi:Spy/CpxP family protein refolding chaperone